MAEPGKSEDSPDVNGIGQVGAPDTFVNHGEEKAGGLDVRRLKKMHEEDGVEFPVDADESRRQGGTSVGIQEKVTNQ